jgi:hypothetical protein
LPLAPQAATLLTGVVWLATMYDNGKRAIDWTR